MSKYKQYTMKKNIVIFDKVVDSDNLFLRKLNEHESWVSKSKKTNHLHGGILKNIIRFIWYFIFPLEFLIQRKKYNKIIGWQQFYGLNFAFWSRLFHLKKHNDLTVMTFIYKKKNSFLGILYHQYMSYIVSSIYVDRYICFAKEECKYYSDLFGVNINKFIYVPLGEPKVEVASKADDGYVFATGRSNRDYNFLVNSLKDTDYTLKIACDTFYYRKNDNIVVLNDCHGQDMYTLMARCHCVIVPLKDLKMSSGQLVVLQAMSLGKPVICTKSDGIKDYVEDKVTGILIDNKKEQLLTALNCLYADNVVYKNMSEKAYQSYCENFTEEAMFERSNYSAPLWA